MAVVLQTRLAALLRGFRGRRRLSKRCGGSVGGSWVVCRLYHELELLRWLRALRGGGGGKRCVVEALDTV